MLFSIVLRQDSTSSGCSKAPRCHLLPSVMQGTPLKLKNATGIDGWLGE
jgi:hypothetical protein